MTTTNVSPRAVKVIRQFSISGVDPFEPAQVCTFAPGTVVSNEKIATRLLELGCPVVAADGSEDTVLTYCPRCRRPVSLEHNTVEIVVPLRRVVSFFNGVTITLDAGQPVPTREVATHLEMAGYPLQRVPGYRCANPECKVVFTE